MHQNALGREVVEPAPNTNEYSKTLHCHHRFLQVPTGEAEPGLWSDPPRPRLAPRASEPPSKKWGGTANPAQLNNSPIDATNTLNSPLVHSRFSKPSELQVSTPHGLILPLPVSADTTMRRGPNIGTGVPRALSARLSSFAVLPTFLTQQAKSEGIFF